jgi:hypothetical protein
MTLPVSLGIAALVSLLVIWALSRDSAKNLREGLSGFGGLLTVLGAGAAIFWYFDQRPDAAKLTMAVDAAAAPAAPGKLLVTGQVTLTNSGTSALELTGSRLRLYVQQVLPLDPKVTASLADAAARHDLDSADNWVLLRRGEVPLDGVSVESGESEQFYVRTLVDCQPGLRLSFSARLTKIRHGVERLSPADGQPLVWIRQTYVDAASLCAKGGR